MGLFLFLVTCVYVFFATVGLVSFILYQVPGMCYVLCFMFLFSLVVLRSFLVVFECLYYMLVSLFCLFGGCVVVLVFCFVCFGVSVLSCQVPGMCFVPFFCVFICSLSFVRLFVCLFVCPFVLFVSSFSSFPALRPAVTEAVDQQAGPI